MMSQLSCTGYAKAELMGRNCRFLQGPDTDKGAVAELRAGIAAAKNVIVELVNYRKDGTKFWNQARALQERERRFGSY